MPPVGIEPATFAPAAHILTQLTKRSGGPDILRIGAFAKFLTRFRQRDISLCLSLCENRGLFYPSGPGSAPGASRGNENENENENK